ncbi:MAG: hypothetical protein R2707_17900 [Acidimicrobiales bacterium]
MVFESRPSADLLQTGDAPPCRIEEQGDAPVLGSGCEGSAEIAGQPRVYDHEACAGWWPEPGHPAQAPGFRCSCTCHGSGNGWIGWDRHLDG